MSLLPARRAPQPVPCPSRPAAVCLMLGGKNAKGNIPQGQKRNKQLNHKRRKKTSGRENKKGPVPPNSAQGTLTDPKLCLLTVLLQVNLDAGFKEVQLGLELLRHGSHGVLHLGQAAVIPEQIHPGGTTRNRTMGWSGSKCHFWYNDQTHLTCQGRSLVWLPPLYCQQPHTTAKSIS